METISHIQSTHVHFPATGPRHGRVAPCERCYRPLTGCITKLCKAPTCTINIFKSSTLAVRTRYGYIFIQVLRSRHRSRAARERLALILYFCRRICGCESLENVRPEKLSRDHLRYQTANRHLGTYSTTSTTMAMRPVYVLSSSLIVSRVMKLLVSFAARKNDKR